MQILTLKDCHIEALKELLPFTLFHKFLNMRCVLDTFLNAHDASMSGTKSFSACSMQTNGSIFVPMDECVCRAEIRQ